MVHQQYLYLERRDIFLVVSIRNNLDAGNICFQNSDERYTGTPLEVNIDPENGHTRSPASSLLPMDFVIYNNKTYASFFHWFYSDHNYCTRRNSDQPSSLKRSDMNTYMTWPRTT